MRSFGVTQRLSLVATLIFFGGLATLVWYVITHPTLWSVSTPPHTPGGFAFMTEEKLEKIAKKPLLLDLNSKMKDRAIDVVKQNMKHTVLYRIKDKYRETHYINQLLCGDIDIIINLPEEEEGYPNDSIIYVHFQERDTRAKVVVYYRKKMKVYLEDYISAAEDINKFMQVRGAKLPNLFRPIHIDTVLLQEHVMVKMMMQNAAGVSLVTPAHSAKVSVTKRGEEKNDGFFVTWKFEYTIPSDKISDVVYVDFKVDKGNFSLPDVSSDIFIKKAIYEEGQYRVDAADEDEFEYTLRTRYLVIDDERQHILRNLFVLDKENPTLAKDYLILYNNVTSEMSCAVVNAAFADGSWIVGNYIVERFDLPSTNFISAQAVIPIKGDSRPVVYPENMSYAHLYQDALRYHVDSIPLGRYTNAETATIALEDENIHGISYAYPHMSGPYSSSYTYKRPLVLNLDESKPREIQEVLLTTDGSMKYYAIAEKYRRNYLFSEVILQNFKFTFCEMGGEIDSYFDTITGVTYTSIDSWGKLDIQYLRNGTVHYEQYLKTPHSIGYVETLGTITPDGNKSYHIDSVMHNGVLLARLMLQNGSGVSLVEPGGLPSAVINFNQLTNSWVISYVVPLVVPKVELNYRLRIKLVYLNGAVTVDAVRNTLLVVTTVNGTELQDTTVHESVAAPVLWLETQRCTVIQSILVPKDEVKDRALLYSFVYVQDRAEIRCVVREAAKAAGEWRYNGKSSRADRDDDDAADDYVDVYRYPCANYAPVSLVVPERSSDVPQVHPKVAGRVRRVKQTTIFIVTMYRDTPHAVSDIHPSDLSWIHLPEMPKLPVKLDLNNTIPAEVSVTTASTTDTFFYVIDPKFKATHNISTLTVRDFKFEVDAEGREHDGTLDTITHVMHTVHDGMESLDVYYKQNSVAKVIFFVKEKGSEEFVETHGTHHVDRNRPPVLILATVGDTVIYRALMDNGEGESLIDPSGRCRVTVDVGRDTTEQRVWITLPIKLPDPGVKDELNIPVIYQNGRATLNLIPNVTKCRIVRRTVGGLAYTAPAVGPQYNKCLGMQLAALRWSQWWLLKAIVVPEVVHKARAKLYSFVYCPQHSTVFAIVQNARMYNNVWTADPEPVGAYRKPSVNVTHSLLRVPIQGSRLPQLYPPEAGWVRNLGQSRYYSVKFRGDSEAYGDDRRKDPILYIRVDGLPKKALELSPQEALPEGIEKFVLKEGSAWYYRLQWDYADTHYISRLLYKSIDFFVKEPEEGDAGANVILSVAVVSKNNEEHVDIHYRESGVNKYDKYVQHRGSMVFVKEKAAVRGTSAPPYGLDIITCGGSLVLKPQLQNSRGQSLVDANSYPGVISWLRGEHSETSLAVALPIKYPGTDAEDRLHMSFVFRRGKLQLHHFENADVLYKVLGTDKDGTPKFVPAVGREFMELSSIKTLAFDGDMHVVIRGTVVLNELVQNGAVAYFFLYDFASATLTCVSSYPLLEDGMYVFTGLFQDRYDLPAQNISQVHFDVPDNALQKYLVYPQEAATVIPLATEQWRALSLSRAKTCDEYKFHPDDTKFIGATGMPKIPIVLSLRDGHLKREAQAIALATPEGTYYRIDPTYAPTHLISTVDIEGLTGPVVKSPNLTLNDINEIVYVHVTRVGNWSRLAVYCSVNGEYYFREYVRENSQNNFRLTHGSLMPGVAPSYMIMTLSYRDRVALQVHLQSKSGQSLLDATETPTAVFYMEKGNQAGKAFVAFPIRYPKTKIKDRLQMTVSVTDDGMEYVPQWRGQSRNFVVTFGNEGNYTVSLPKSIEYKEYVKHDGRRREDSKEQHIIKTVMVPNGDNNSKTARVYTFLCDTRTHIITCNVAEARLEDGMWKINEHVDVEYMFPTTGVGAAAIDVVLRDGIPKPVVLPSAAARIKEPGEHLYIVVQKPPQARDGTDLHPMDVPNFASHMLPMIPVDLDLLHSIPLEVEVEMGESDNVTHYRVKQAFVKSHYIRRVTYGTFSSIIQSRREITSHRDGGSVFVIKECDEVNEFLYVGTEQGRKLMAKYQIENDHQTAKLTAVYHIGGRLSA